MNATAPLFAVQGTAADRAMLERIVATVAESYGVEPATILGSRRYYTITRPRHVAVYLARKLTGLSLHQLGYAFRRDHSTIAQTVKRLAGEMAEDVALAVRVDRLRFALEAVG